MRKPFGMAVFAGSRRVTESLQKITNSYSFDFSLDICGPEIYFSFGPHKEVTTLAAKMGRPTDNPKGKSIHVRLDAESEKILDEYTKKHFVSRAEAIRIGIKKLSSE